MTFPIRLMLSYPHPAVLPQLAFVPQTPAVFKLGNQGTRPDKSHSGYRFQTELLFPKGFDQFPQDIDVGRLPAPERSTSRVRTFLYSTSRPRSFNTLM